MENTKPGYGSMELYNVWTVDREGEAQRFKTHDKMDNRKLLWHGTNGEATQLHSLVPNQIKSNLCHRLAQATTPPCLLSCVCLAFPSPPVKVSSVFKATLCSQV